MGSTSCVAGGGAAEKGLFRNVKGSRTNLSAWEKRVPMASVVGGCSKTKNFGTWIKYETNDKHNQALR